MVKRSLQLGLLFVALVFPIFGTRADSAPTPYVVNGLLSLSGPVAFSGNEHLSSLNLIADYVNAHGGIQGHPLQFAIKDDQSSPVKAVQLASEMVEAHVPVIVGPSVTATCAAVTGLIKTDGPVLYCMSPALHPKRGGYIFASGLRIADDAAGILHYAADRGWTRIATITATDASGQEVDRAFSEAFALPENKRLQLVDVQHFNASDISVSAQMAHIQSANPNVIVAWTIGASFGTLLHGIHDAGVTAPIIAGPANMLKTQLQGYGALVPDELYFSGMVGMALGKAPAGPMHDAQATYLGILKKAGVEDSASRNGAWDYTLVLVQALQHLGPSATATEIRDYIDNLHGWVGIQGTYDYHDPEQRGIGADAVEMFRWDRATGDFVNVSGPAGHVQH